MSPSAPARNNRILVIDDNASIHEDIRKILKGGSTQSALDAIGAEMFGDEQPAGQEDSFVVDSAMQGEEGFRMVGAAAEAGRPYAMAFVDIRMPPGWDGIETIARIWQRFPEVQMVICTAYSDYSWEEMTRKIGRSASLLILKKPFDNIEVLQLANALTQKWSLNHEVHGRLQDLDQLVARRSVELQLVNDQLRNQIAEQSRLETQLRQAQKMEAVGQLAAGVAHDFNNILTVVQGNSSLLLSAKSPDSPDYNSLKNICSATDRAAKLVSQLLTFCRKQVVEMRPTDLRQLLDIVIEMLPRVLTPAVKVQANVTEGVPGVNADAGMMETVLMNLAVNARDAMPEGGTIKITVAPVNLGPKDVYHNPEARAGDFVRLSVSDTGAGIPPEVLPRIFEPFFTTKPMGKGTGLGLATVYGIVQQHQGWVEVQTKLKEGTTFHIFLPALAAAVPVKSQSTKSAPARPTAGARETVLVVDDEPDLRDLVVQILETGGYDVLSAGSGAEALQQWSAHRGGIHLLLTDMVMPDGLTGRKLAEQLRKDDPHLRVIYTSGYNAGQPGTDLVNIEEQNFLPKPYRPAALLRLVRECLDQPNPVRANAAQQAA